VLKFWGSRVGKSDRLDDMIDSMINHVRGKIVIAFKKTGTPSFRSLLQGIDST
jgi:hypothetical protein